MNKHLVCALLACVAGGAGAQQARPQRYIDAEGVEIIQNRDATRPPSVAPPRAGAVKTTGVTGEAADRKLQVSAAEQSARDLDRAAILREELAHEMRKFEAATKALVQTRQAAGSQPLAGATLKQLKEVVHMHQQNIQSLTAELRRTGGSR